MPFSGRAEVTKSRHWKQESTGRTFSPFTGWKPDDCVLVDAGWDIYWHGDSTVGRCKPPFKTEAEAVAFADKWNKEYGYETEDP